MKHFFIWIFFIIAVTVSKYAAANELLCPLLLNEALCSESSYGSLQPQLFHVNLNQTEYDHAVLFLVNDKHQFFVYESDLISWRLHFNKNSAISYKNKNYYRLTDFPQLVYSVDWTQMDINILAPPSMFDSTELNSQRAAFGIEKTMPRAIPGGFFNYNVNLNRVNNLSQGAELLEAGVFNQLGVGVSDFLVEQNINSLRDQVTRLQTTWTYDDPISMQTLRLGDAASCNSMWSNSVLFGGIQYGTNFSTQPSFITYPLPSVTGEAVMPSVVDLYVNNAIIQKQQVPTGPFTINNIPVVANGGTLNIVTTNVLGKQQVVNVPYYTYPQMLKPNIQDFSLEAGFIRNNFSINSNDYGRFMVMGTDEVGLTDNITAEVHGAYLTNQQELGLGGLFLLGDFGVLNAATAVSYNKSNQIGNLGQIGLQHIFPYQISFGTNIQTTTQNFATIGIYPTTRVAPSLQSQIFIGLPPFYGNSLGMSYVTQNNRGSLPNYQFINVNYSRSIANTWAVSATAITSPTYRNSTSFLLSITMLIDSQTSLSAVGSEQNGVHQEYAQLSRALPNGVGYGYSLAAGTGNQTPYQAAFLAQNDYQSYAIQATQLQGLRNYEAQISGGVAVLNNHAFLSRQITNSFGVVEVPGYANVDVYAYNQLAGHTDKHGYALIPNLQPYQDNIVRIDPNDLPINTQINTIELNAKPYYRSGMLLSFPVEKMQAALMTVKLDNGDVLPMGTQVIVEGQKTPYLVANSGRLYINGLLSNNRLIATWDNGSCVFTVHYPKTKEIYPDLGIVVCH